MTWLRDVVVALLATSGLRLDKLSVHRLALLGASVLVYLWMMRNATLEIAIAYYATYVVLRYLFLFTSFIRNGIAERLIAAHGERKGYEIYETITALMFFHSASAFSTLVSRTEWTLAPASAGGELFVVAGLILSALGFVVNLWGTLIIGVDVYYYKDLFLGRFLGEFKQEGPYRIFKNPMYGIGQSAAYGAALMSGSLAGILATLLNQALMYAFYFTIEKPHVMRMIARSHARPYPRLEAAAPETAG